MVLFATYLYSGADSRRSRPPPINIANYEKTVTDNGFTPCIEEDREHMFLDPLTPLRTEGSSTSRPTSPVPGHRHHSRRGSARNEGKSGGSGKRSD